MKTNDKHWDSIFSDTKNSSLGWYEKDPIEIIGLLNQIKQWQNSTIFVAGAGTSTLIDKLSTRNTKLVLNDISSKALDKLKDRIGKQEERITWLHQDIAQPIPKNSAEIDIWIDRATLHFLTEKSAIKGYFNNLKSVLRIGGYVIFAEFSKQGAKKCAGLSVHQYSLAELSTNLGKSFQLITHFNHTFINPYGDEKAYIYALYQRV